LLLMLFIIKKKIIKRQNIIKKPLARYLHV
jgi:hypothetical protein